MVTHITGGGYTSKKSRENQETPTVSGKVLKDETPCLLYWKKIKGPVGRVNAPPGGMRSVSRGTTWGPHDFGQAPCPCLSMSRSPRSGGCFLAFPPLHSILFSLPPADEMTVGKVYAALMIFDFYKQNKTTRDQIHQAAGGLSQVPGSRISEK